MPMRPTSPLPQKKLAKGTASAPNLIEPDAIPRADPEELMGVDAPLVHPGGFLVALVRLDVGRGLTPVLWWEYLYAATMDMLD